MPFSRPLAARAPATLRKGQTDSVRHTFFIYTPLRNEVPEELQRREGLDGFHPPFPCRLPRGPHKVRTPWRKRPQASPLFVAARSGRAVARTICSKQKSDRLLSVAAAAFGSRRERDSNPRYSYPYTAFRVRPDRPLRHLSNMLGLSQPPYLSDSLSPPFIFRPLGLRVSRSPQPDCRRLIGRASRFNGVQR